MHYMLHFLPPRVHYYNPSRHAALQPAHTASENALPPCSFRASNASACALLFGIWITVTAFLACFKIVQNTNTCLLLKHERWSIQRTCVLWQKYIFLGASSGVMMTNVLSTDYQTSEKVTIKNPRQTAHSKVRNWMRRNYLKELLEMM